MLYFLPANRYSHENSVSPVPFTMPALGETEERWVISHPIRPNHWTYSARIKLHGIVIWEHNSDDKQVCHVSLMQTMCRIHRLCSEDKSGIVDLMS